MDIGNLTSMRPDSQVTSSVSEWSWWNPRRFSPSFATGKTSLDVFSISAMEKTSLDFLHLCHGGDLSRCSLSTMEKTSLDGPPRARAPKHVQNRAVTSKQRVK
ncbi:hypothetical protein PMIN06_012894 [Paraphaeosphaeria minitans]